MTDSNKKLFWALLIFAFGCSLILTYMLFVPSLEGLARSILAAAQKVMTGLTYLLIGLFAAFLRSRIEKIISLLEEIRDKLNNSSPKES